MGDPPTINGKIGKKFPNRGEGVPDLGKIPTFSRFFFGNVPNQGLIMAGLNIV